MGPGELAALVAREADAGVAGALSALDAAGVLQVESVTGRIGSRPATDTTSWDDLVWQAEVVMRPTGVTPAGVGTSDTPRDLDVPEVIASLPVSALRGVGARWAHALTERGVTTVGALASVSPGSLAQWSRERQGGYAVQLVARARTCEGSWPKVDRTDVRSVVEVSEADPGDASGWPPGSRSEAYSLWATCLRLRSAIDDAVLEQIRVNGS